MSGTLNKLFEKGKAKVKEFQNQPHGGGAGGGYPGQQHQHHQQPQQYQQYSGAPYPPQQPYPPPNNPPYQQYQQQQQYPPPAPYQQQSPPPQSPHQQQQWGPPPNQWAPPSHQQPQWGQPPTQALSPPPVPQHSKPQSPQPPPIPPNHPVSHPPPPQPQPQPPPPQGAPPRTTSGVYWKPSFDPLTPVSQNFEHELGDHGWGNNEKQNYTNNPANSFHHNNHLIVRALVQNGTYTSARLSSRQTLARARGYLTATILAPCAEGIWPAFWVLPKEPFQWPNDGEVDIMESWNGDCVNHSCLHWGHYNGEDWNKHRVVETKLHDMPHQPHTFGFAWIEEDGIPDWRGRMIWYIDGRPIMKGNIPAGTKRMEEFRLLINVAMGGNVCGGKLPKDGYYDLVISDLTMCEEPVGGWGEFERTWGATPEGKTM